MHGCSIPDRWIIWALYEFLTKLYEIYMADYSNVLFDKHLVFEECDVLYWKTDCICVDRERAKSLCLVLSGGIAAYM